MLTSITKPYIYTALVVLLLGSFAYGYHKGSISEIAKYEKSRLALQEEIFDLADDISIKNIEILRLQQEQQELIYDLEIEATNAEGSNSLGVTANGGLQRLERRWGPVN